MTVDPIRVRGLDEFRKALLTMDDGSEKKLRTTMNVVAEAIAADTRSKVPTRSGKARASVKVASSQQRARIKAGGNKAPYYPWLDFGGAVGRQKAVRRPFIRDRGRYLYPTYFASRPAIQEALEAALRDLVKEAGLDVG